MTPHERRRWCLWLAMCEHMAVKPWVRTCHRLAEAAGDVKAAQSYAMHYAEIDAGIDDLKGTLWAMDPEWALTVLARFEPLPRNQGWNDDEDGDDDKL